MSMFIGKSYEPDMTDEVIDTQLERYSGSWQTKEGKQPVGYSAGCHKQDNLSRLRLSLRDTEFFHGKDSEVYWEVLTD
jgi:hypothetical protein